MKIRNHVKSIFLILVTVVIMAIFKIVEFDASANLDFAFFLTCVLYLIVLFSFGWMLFQKGKKETCIVTVFCAFSLIVSIHKLHRISILTRELKNFSILSPYMIAFGIMVVIAIILLLIKYTLQSSEITKSTTANAPPNNENTKSSHLLKQNNDDNSIGYKISIVLINIILILVMIIGFYFIHNVLSADTPIWQEALVVIVGIPVLCYVSLWFSKEILNLFKYKEDRFQLLNKIKMYWLSLIIAGVLEYFGYKNGFSSGLFKNFASTNLSHFVSFPLTLILILITTLILAFIIHKILLDFMNIEEDKWPSDRIQNFLEEFRDEIFKIVQELWKIVLNVIKGLIEFVKWIPSFFGVISKLVVPKEEIQNLPEKKQNSALMKLAAFCFTIISCITTFVGLREFVFSKNDAWQAGLISFAIQTILFVINLKFPEFLHKILENISFDGNKFKYKIKKILMCFLFVLSFTTVLLSSSLFSFVYIFDESYLSRDISYIDANSVLMKEYNEVLNDTNTYIDENIKATLIIASGQLSDLNLPNNQSIEKTIEELQDELTEAKKALNEAEIVKSNAEKSYNDAVIAYNNAQKDVKALEGVAYSESERYEGAKKIRDKKEDEKNNAKDVWDDALVAYTKANNNFIDAENAVNNYKPSENEIIKEFLSELLKEEPNEKIIESDMSALSDMISVFGNSEIDSHQFSDIVQKTKALSVTIEQLKSLTTKKNNLLERDYLLEEVELISSVDETSDWKKVWQEKFNNLKILVEDIPSYAKSNSVYLENTTIDIDLLENYDSSEKIDILNQSERLYLSDINKIEKSLKSLRKAYGNKYIFNACFSAILALFFDLTALLVGLFIYYYEKDNSNTNKYEILPNYTEEENSKELLLIEAGKEE